jgi:hypothetical protein
VQVELRLYVSSFGGEQSVRVIKCIGDSVLSEIYTWVDRTTENSFMHSPVGKNLVYNSLMVKKLNIFKKGLTWNLFFQRLIDNHLLSIPGQNNLNIEVLKNYPETNLYAFEQQGRIAIEIKIDNRFREVEYFQTYDPKPQLTNYMLVQNVLDSLLNDISFN